MAATLILQYAAATGFHQRHPVGVIGGTAHLRVHVLRGCQHGHLDLLNEGHVAAINNPAQYAPLFALAIASQAVDTNSADAAIQTMVANVWNTLAGMP